MWEVTSLAGAIPAVLIGWITLGLMPICWKVLERRGRCLGHTLLDFSFVSLLGGCGAALLFGSLPRETAEEAAKPYARQDILPQLGQHNGKLVGFALASGACFTFADVFLQQAMPLVGLVTAAAISNALRIIISVMTNYFLDGRLDNGALLFPGLGLALAAIVCSTAAQVRHRRTETEQKVAAEATRREAELCDLKVHRDSQAEAPPPAAAHQPDPTTSKAQVHPEPLPRSSKKSLARSNSKPKPLVLDRDSKDTSSSSKDFGEQASPNPMIRSPALSTPSRRPHAQDAPVVEMMPKAGDLQDNKIHQQIVPPTAGDNAVTMSCIDMAASRAAMLKGLALSAACGVSYGLYSPAFNIATNDHFHMAGPGAQPMNAWTAILYLYLGLWFVSFIINTYFLYRPPQGPASTITKYGLDWFKNRGIAILSGIFGLISAIAELVGGQAGGYAFASLVAAYPLVTTIVGMVCFGEFRGAARSTQVLLAAMFSLYLAAVALIACSAKLRPAAQR